MIPKANQLARGSSLGEIDLMLIDAIKANAHGRKVKDIHFDPYSENGVVKVGIFLKKRKLIMCKTIQVKDLKWEDEPREVELFIKPIDKPKEMSVKETMAYLEEKIAKASKSWEGVDVDKFLDEIRGREPDDLEEAADEWILSHNNGEVLYVRDAFIAGAKWMESQMPMPEDTVIFMKGVEEGRRLEREDRNDDNLPRYYGG